MRQVFLVVGLTFAVAACDLLKEPPPTPVPTGPFETSVGVVKMRYGRLDTLRAEPGVPPRSDGCEYLTGEKFELRICSGGIGRPVNYTLNSFGDAGVAALRPAVRETARIASPQATEAELNGVEDQVLAAQKDGKAEILLCPKACFAAQFSNHGSWTLSVHTR